jgi:16S rRNA G1207 methylase RsmC
MELDLAHQAQIFVGTFERETYRSLIDLSKGIKSAADIGCAHGEYSLYLLKKTTAEKIYIFEPSHEVQPLFERNLRHNGLNLDNDKIVFFNKLVAEQLSETTITLDSLLPLPQPCLVKMDVDGAEVNILRGAAMCLNQQDTRWIVETHSKQLEIECMEIFEQAGYYVKILRNAWWRAILPEQRGSIQNRWLIAYRKGI